MVSGSRCQEESRGAGCRLLPLRVSVFSKKGGPFFQGLKGGVASGLPSSWHRGERDPHHRNFRMLRLLSAWQGRDECGAMTSNKEAVSSQRRHLIRYGAGR